MYPDEAALWPVIKQSTLCAIYQLLDMYSPGRRNRR
jgi:hypothetical protein